MMPLSRQSGVPSEAAGTSDGRRNCWFTTTGNNIGNRPYIRHRIKHWASASKSRTDLPYTLPQIESYPISPRSGSQKDRSEPKSQRHPSSKARATQATRL